MCLFAIAVTLRVLLLLQNHFDGLYGQDSYAYYDYARQMYQAISHFQALASFWWPLGYPGLLSMGFFILGTGIQAAQVVTLLSGALIAPLTFLLARELMHGPTANLAGIVAGLIVALSGQLVESSVVIMADAPALMWATASAWLLLRYRRSAGTASILLSGVAMSLAVITRWQYLGFAPVWLMALLMPAALLKGQGILLQISRHLRRHAGVLFTSIVLAALVLAPQLIYQTAYGAPLAGQSWLEGWSPANLLARSFNTPDGHFDYALPVSIFYSQAFFHPAYLFPLLSPALVLGIWLLAKRIHMDPTAFVLILGWAGVLYLFLAGIPYENFRFGLGLIVPVAVLAGEGVAWTWGELNQRHLVIGESVRRTLLIAFVVLLAISVSGAVAWEPRAFQPVLAEKQMELQAQQWLSARLAARTTVYTFGLTEALQHYSSLNVKDLSDESADRIAADVRAQSPAYLFVDQTNIETQWRGMPLRQNLEILRQQVGLTELGVLDHFTLFLIGAGR